MNTIALPENFPIPTNTGLHGDMQFFEMPNFQMTTEEPEYKGDTVAFTYTCHDSDEGEVTITYNTIDGSDAENPEDDVWDVAVTTGSDVWGLEATALAIADAIALHNALGRDERFAK